MDEADKTALLDTIDACAEQLGPSRPNAARVTRAKTLLKEIKVTCQNIAVSPVDENDTSVPPPTPGPETPPIDPAPPETPPSGGGGGGSTSPPTTTTVTTTYTSAGDFVGSQGYRGWSYLDGNLASTITYDSARALWTGPELYQFIWDEGCHSGPTTGVVRRFTSPSAGTYSITGSIKFYNDPIGGTSALPVTIKKNGASVYSQTVADNDITGYTVSSVTGSIAVGDTLDFIVGPPSGPGTSHENFNSTFSIALTTTTTTGSGSPTQTALPFTLNGTAPQEGTLTISANKPSNATGCTIAVTGMNLSAAYGRIYFNGSTNSVAVWDTAPANAGISATVTLTVPVSYMVNGSNTLRFTHDSGTGYTVTAVGTPAFTTPTTPTPPATQTSLPFNLRGSILPEDAILTVPLTKPSNANGATMTITGVNLTGTQGSYYINGSLASVIWADTPANAGVSATVTRTPDVNLFVNGNNTIRFTHTEGSGYTVSAVNVTFSTTPPSPDPGPVPGNNSTFTNEPAGMTALFNGGFSSMAGLLDVYGSTALSTDGSAPLSPPNVAVHRLGPFEVFGGGELHYNAPNLYREMFFGLWWRTNQQFQGRISGNKLFFLRGLPGTNGVFYMYGGPNMGLSNFRLIFSHNSAHLDNSHIMSADLGLQAEANVGSGLLIPGQWYKIECHIRASTTTTSRDGSIRWWLNGAPSGAYTQFNYAAAGSTASNPGFVNNWTWSETWDGSGDMGRSNTVEWNHYVDHLYVSGKN